MKVIIAGSRTYTNEHGDEVVFDDLQKLAFAVYESEFFITEVVSGTARGVGTLGEKIAEGIKVPVKRIPDLRGKNPLLLSYAIIAPIAHSMIALGLAALFGVSLGNTILLMVLAASASYIAVPAAVKHAIPEANPSVYVGLSLGLTFPFNVLVGIPLYSYLANSVL